MNNKTIAMYERDFIGGTPKVERFENDDADKSIDILSVNDGCLKNRSVYATIGLHKEDIGLSIDGIPLRAELIFAAKADHELNKNILASAAFECMERKQMKPGILIPNVIHSYIKDCDVKHFVCMTPVFWENCKVLKDEDETVAWLQLVPVTDAELAYIESNGLSAFDELLAAKNADITAIRRKSII